LAPYNARSANSTRSSRKYACRDPAVAHMRWRLRLPPYCTPKNQCERRGTAKRAVGHKISEIRRYQVRGLVPRTRAQQYSRQYTAREPDGSDIVGLACERDAWTTP
jgi:hypothetical protein